MATPKYSKWADLGVVPEAGVRLDEARRLVAWGVKRGLLRFPLGAVVGSSVSVLGSGDREPRP